MDQLLLKFYDYVLNLDYFKDIIVEEQQIKNLELDGTYEAPAEEKSMYAEVPLEFVDVKDYHKVWEPLFFIESKANILKSIQAEQVEQVQCRIIKINEETDFFTMEVSLDQTAQIYAHDLVMFSSLQINTNKPDHAYVPHTLGIVETNSQNLRFFTILKGQSERIQSMQSGIKQNLTSKSPFYLNKLCGLSTIEREYKAFANFATFYLCNNILHPMQIEQSSQYFSIPSALEAKLKDKYNDSQFEAIRQTLKTEGITLIQGPPGTGKTKTVIGTVSVLLQSQQQKQEMTSTTMQEETLDGSKVDPRARSPWLNPNYDDWRDHVFEFCQDDINKYFGFQTFEQAHQTDHVHVLKKRDNFDQVCPEKILVCGPSNTSVDEIIKKVLEDGLLDENGRKYTPFIVRIGENYDSSVAHVALDNLVKQKMFEQQLKEDQAGFIKSRILNQAKIIFGTLSSSGSQVLAFEKLQFDTVIVDEAAQAVEISSLIPLQYGCKRLILIGDPNQLPATVFSKTSERYKYSLSLFERLQKNKLPVHLLKVQYRMHPTISKFISSSFYKSELIDAPNLIQLIGQPQIYNYYAFSQLVVFHVKGYEQFHRNSYRNEAETQVVTELLVDLLGKYGDCDLKTVGIVSPYTAQIQNIQKSLKKALHVQDLPIEVKTVDGFQGREKDIIILSTVRSSFVAPGQFNPIKSIGFLRDARRMNVSLSRCRQSLIVVCDVNKLKMNKLWRALIEYSFELGSCYSVRTSSVPEWFKEFDSNPLKFQMREFKKKAVFKKVEPTTNGL